MALSYSTRVFWSLSALGGVYAVIVALLINPWIQRHALYAHKLHTGWLHDVSNPESFGFAQRQVTPFYISTPDNETLYAWHIIPLSLYAKHEQALLGEPEGASTANFLQSVSFDLLQDPDARLVVNFHGNAGDVAQGWRTETYRALSASESDKTHVIAFDYRGFGLSTGSPTESGLIADGMAVVDWALRVARIPPERIVLVGQSLGTAVATAVTDHFISSSPPVELAGLVLVSGFSDIPTLMKSYKIAGFIPILSPLRLFPTLQDSVSYFILDTWHTATRLTHITSLARSMRLFIVHARDDFDIGWKHSDVLLKAAVKGPKRAKHIQGKFDITKTRCNLDEGGFVNVFEGNDHATIRQEIVQYGGHNRIVTFAVVTLAVLRAFV